MGVLGVPPHSSAVLLVLLCVWVTVHAGHAGWPCRSQSHDFCRWVWPLLPSGALSLQREIQPHLCGLPIPMLLNFIRTQYRELSASFLPGTSISFCIEVGGMTFVCMCVGGRVGEWVDVWSGVAQAHFLHRL